MVATLGLAVMPQAALAFSAADLPAAGQPVTLQLTTGEMLTGILAGSSETHATLLHAALGKLEVAFTSIAQAHNPEALREHYQKTEAIQAQASAAQQAHAQQAAAEKPGWFATLFGFAKQSAALTPAGMAANVAMGGSPVPQLPGVAGVTGVPGASGVPGVGGLPGAPAVPGMPGIPQANSPAGLTGGVPSIAGGIGGTGLDAASGVPAFGGGIGGTGLAATPSVPSFGGGIGGTGLDGAAAGAIPGASGGLAAPGIMNSLQSAGNAAEMAAMTDGNTQKVFAAVGAAHLAGAAVAAAQAGTPSPVAEPGAPLPGIAAIPDAPTASGTAVAEAAAAPAGFGQYGTASATQLAQGSTVPVPPVQAAPQPTAAGNAGAQPAGAPASGSLASGGLASEGLASGGFASGGPAPGNSAAGTSAPEASPAATAASTSISTAAGIASAVTGTTATVAAASPVPLTGWTGEFGMGIDGARGNAERSAVRLLLGAETERPGSEWRFNSSYNRAEGADTINEDRLLADLRKDWLWPGSPWGLFGEMYFELDELKDYDFRLNALLGPSYRFIDNDTTEFVASLGAGASQKVGGLDDRVVPEAFFGLDFEYDFNDAHSLVTSLDVYPDLDDMGEFRMVGQLDWDIALATDIPMSLRIGMEDRYDSAAADGVKQNDFDYHASIVRKF